jgi:hypothetical protein
MPKTSDILVIHYSGDRIPDDRPGEPATGDEWYRVWKAIQRRCGRHGFVGPYHEVDYDALVYWVVEDQYNEERYQYVEICKSAGMHAAWLLDLMKTLRRFPSWGAGIVNLGGGYLMVFADRLMVTGPTFDGAANFDDVVRCARHSLELQEIVAGVRDDAGLEQLAQIPELRDAALVLGQLDQVTDLGLPLVATLRGATWLNLTDSYVTDSGLPHLKPLTQLEDLSLSGTRVTGEGLVHLVGLPSLKEIEVGGCPLTAAGFRALAQFVDLEQLDLSETCVSDAELSLFEGHKRLCRLWIAGTQVSDAAIARFSNSVPNCEILGRTS